MFYTASTFFFDILQEMGYLHGFEVMETLGSIKPARVHLFFSISFFSVCGAQHQLVSAEETSYGYFACETVETKSINTGQSLLNQSTCICF